MATTDVRLVDDPLWYKDAVIYELHVKSFRDSNGDGMGDFPGLLEKLDYLEALGITAIWLLPFYPSPLRDDGYDISDYYGINPDYGSVADFRRFVREAHRRGLRVITELVINHTSDQHPWFQRSRREKPGSAWRDFYVWSDDPDRYREARIIFRDFERSNWTWDPVAGAYYWHRFYSHQPDLNFDNPRVRREILRIMDFWFDAGVDGVRLDAIPYLYEREGTHCENLPETHAFLKELRAHLDATHRDRMLLAEANQWPEDAARYFGDGDECHMCFHFPVMPRLFMALRMEDRFPVVDILEQTPAIPANCQWAMFLRNHDELTLEMVTDEERDYMYRVYAQDNRMRINLGIRRRLAPLLNNDRRAAELMNVLLLSLPGTPVLYYGDEIGMGDNFYLGDRDGVRTPMQWSPDRNAGFSSASPHRLYLPVIQDSEYHAAAVNVENQEPNPASLLWWMRRLIATRRAFPAFGRGDMTFIASDNAKVLSFVRRHGDQHILVVANLAGSHQAARLELSSYGGWTPVDVFSGNRFPSVDADPRIPYVLTMGPREFFWLQLRPVTEAVEAVEPAEVPDLAGRLTWAQVADGSNDAVLEQALRPYIRARRWFGGKGRTIRRLRVRRRAALGPAAGGSVLALLEVSYVEGAAETYVVPLSFARGADAEALVRTNRPAAVAWLGDGGARGVLYDGVFDPQFRQGLLNLVDRSSRRAGGEVVGERSGLLRRMYPSSAGPLESTVLKAEQSNSAVVYGQTFFLKLFRKVEPGISGDLEISRFLTERTAFRNLPAYAGAVLWRPRREEPVVLAMLQQRVANEGDAWEYTRSAIERYMNRALARGEPAEAADELPPDLLRTTRDAIPPALQDLIGVPYLEMIALLGQRTAEFHQAMASVPSDPTFAPEPFTKLYQRSVYQAMWSLLRRTMRSLRGARPRLPEALRPLVEQALAAEREIAAVQNRVVDVRLEAMKLRIHDDYHLGQVLFTGKDFVLIDFEGEPARPLGERRLKRSPLRDVAGMIRSFHYAAYGSMVFGPPNRISDPAPLERWAALWYRAVSGVFLEAYLGTIRESRLVPTDAGQFDVLLHALLLDKAVYELGYELNNRPDWLVIPLRGVQQVLQEAATPTEKR